MTSPHCDHLANAQRFGQVTVTVDLDAGDCVIRAPQPGPVTTVSRTRRFHSLDEIRGAYRVQVGLAATDPMAKDIAAALNFAGQRLKEHRGDA